MSPQVLKGMYGKAYHILQKLSEEKINKTHKYTSFDDYVHKHLPVNTDARSNRNKKGICRKKKEPFAEIKRDATGRRTNDICYLSGLHVSEPSQIESHKLREHLELKPEQQGYRWSVNEARARRERVVSDQTRVASGALQLDILSWSSGESRGFHHLDEFRAGAWAVGLAQEADDPRPPDPMQHSSGRKRKRHECSDEEDDSEDDSEETDPRGVEWPEWSHMPENKLDWEYGWRRRRWYTITPRKILAGDPQRPATWLNPPVMLMPDRMRRETRAHTRQPALSKGYGYNQAGFMKNLGYKVVSLNGHMIYAKSHACTDITVLQSDTIRSQSNENKWDLHPP